MSAAYVMVSLSEENSGFWGDNDDKDALTHIKLISSSIRNLYREIRWDSVNSRGVTDLGKKAVGGTSSGKSGTIYA